MSLPASAGASLENGRAPGGARRRLLPVLAGIAVIAASYVFLSFLAQEDREGHRTLSTFSVFVALLRGLGRLVAKVAEPALVVPVLPPLLGVAALLLLRRYRPRRWRDDVALALVVASLSATAFFLRRGNLGPAAMTGLLAGIGLLAAGRGETGHEPSPLLFLVPLGLAIVLRFHALGEVPKGYAEHAVAAHVGLSLPYLEALSASLDARRLQPFLGTASHALLYQQSGFSSLVAAVGFELFGVTLTVTRLVSAALGVLTIFVAYRLGRALDGVRLGLVFSFLLAISPWHVTISRYGTQEHVLPPLQFLLSLLFVVLAVNGGRVLNILLAALFTALAWHIYATNLVVPAIAGLFLLCRAVADPRLAVRGWKKTLLGLACFALLSYPSARNLFPHGVFLPNVRTGHQESGPILSDSTKRAKMIALESDQLFRNAADPWFSMAGGGLGLLQSALLVPGLVLAAGALRQRRWRDLALVVLIGLPLAALPAVLAPDPTWRRLMLVATLAALVSAFTLVKMAEAVRAVVLPGRVRIAILCAGVLALAAVDTFGYFDRAFLGEDSGPAFRNVGAAVSGLLGKKPLVIVVPVRDNLNDMRRYIRLMAYDALLEAQRRGVSPEALFRITSCEDPFEKSGPQTADASPPLLILHDFVSKPPLPCGPEFVVRLKAHYPQSTVVIAKSRAPG